MKNIILSIFIVLLLPIQLFAKKLPVQINFINAGEGDAALIQTSNGKNILIDSGNLISGVSVLNFLKEKKIKTIDYFIITHPHQDHIGGVFVILQNIKVINKYDNGENLDDASKDEDIYRLYQDIFRIQNNGIYKQFLKNDIITIHDLEMIAIHPSLEKNGNWNENSLAIYLKYGNFTCLFMGDGLIKTEEELLKNNLLNKTSILKAGHHAAGDTGSIEFIEKTKPDVVIVSVNKNNIRNYPSQEVMNNYKKHGAIVLETNEQKNILITGFKSGKYTIKKEK